MQSAGMCVLSLMPIEMLHALVTVYLYITIAPSLCQHRMSKVGYSCTVRLFLLLFQTVWLHISIAKAELTFLGQEPFRAYASQGSLTGVSLYQFFVIDTQSQNDQVEVSFSIEQTNLPFVLTPSSGELLVTGDLIEEVYTFTVQAVSSSATILTNITVNVVSISDTSPRFEHAQYNLEVSEALQTDSPLGVVRAFSLNPGTMSQRYSIVAGNTDSDISITSNTGLLRVGRRLDRERTELYQLTIRYVDDVASVDATVSLSVLDVNDESPQFSMPLYSVVIPETVSVGTVVLAVNASDRDIGVNARVTYSLEPSVSEVFSLNTEDGVLRTAALLDYERQLRYQFRVTATDGGNPSLSSVATVLINLENIDDECPRFENPVFIEELPYDIAGTPPSVGTEILTVVATDPDRFSDVSYSIVSGQTEVLELDSLTGVITLASTGSGDPRGQYMLNVSASDASCIGQSFARVEIGIGNVNDHSPQFVTECVASLSENPPRGTEVVTLRATDLDIGFNGLVTYSVSSTERFQIESTSGVVRTTAEPSLYDREDRSTYQVGVTASDGGGRQDYCLLTITLLDENDNPPQIPLSSYTTSLSRSSIRGTFVLQITAQDQDVGDNGRIVYSISSSSLLPFQISNVSGVITTSDTLPSDDSFTFTVVAADLGTTIQLTSSALVTITLTDSDSLPRFSEMNYTGSVCENAVAGTTVLTVNVSNPSPTDFIQFDILEGSDYHSNLDRTFSIREDTTFFNLATIIVGSQSIVDFERLHPNPNFQFFVSATNIHGSSIVPVEIFVMDIDDNPPEFSTNIFISIAENEPVGTTVATVQATDLDSGANGEIRYRFRAGQTQSYFNITSDGTITSNQMFDYETSENTAGTLIVEAYNPNSEPSSSVCVSFPQGVDTNLIQWSIIDQNDNPPSFLASSYIIDVPENTSLLTRVFMLNATDRDISDLGRLSFSILSGNDGNFGIDSNFIVLTGRLDFETTPTYDLQIQVTDGSFSNSNCLQCTTTVCIQVTNTDDESPVFLSPEYHATVVENSQIGTSVLTISATDVDSPSIEYELAGLAEGRFSVNKSGVVFVSGNIDREEFPGGSLVFLAFAEGGSLATANIFIDIDDENDYEPRFSTVFRGSVVENQLPGDEGIYASEVRAVDLDRGENGTVSYSLISGEESGFRIDLQTGVISAHAEFDREAVSSYLLTVEARDNGSSVQLSSQTQVVIEIGDVDDNPASFPFPYMFSRLYENPPLGHSVIFLPAVDPDTSADSALVFALSDTHPPEPKFAVNSSTGEITVTGSLDYEIPLHRLYTLTVSVMDPDYPQTSSGTLQIQLLDRNDNAPEITISQPQSNLQETHPLGAQVAMVTASDGDSGNNLELIFALTDGNSNDDFELVIENGEGIIRSAHQFDYETTSIYVLTVTVSDRGNPPMSSSVPLEFNIIDVNDESPVFTQSVYSVSIQENSSPMNNLIQVMASDRDTGIGGEIAGYEIVEGNEKGRFILSSSGVLASLVMFDREEQSEYTLTVAAYDRGAEPQRGIAEICVTITDVSDSLSLSGGHLTVLIYALDGLAPRGDIAPLYFIDPDSDDTFTDCIVRAQDHVEIFSIDASTCIVRLDVSNPEEGVYNYLTVDGRVRGPNVAVEASATITVKHIDSSLISVDNLVTVTIDASFEAYINEPLSTSLPSQLAIVLEISEEDLRIITVQRGAFLPDSTVDISFTATSGDGTLFLSTEILHQLFLRRESLDIDGHTLLNLPLDACASEPCQNQAGCRTVWSVSPTEKVISTQQFVFFAPRIDFSYECLCSPGTTGEHCETNFDDCYSNPCQHGAACTDLINGFSCDCPEGYSGVDCSVPPPDCSTNVCQNGATCTVVNGDTSCKCHPGYYGPLCQYHYFIPSSFCSHDNNPCQNGADCSPGRDSFTCVCLPGFLGEFCENPTLLQGGCIDNPCYNGSTCEETPTGPTCICSIGFTGPNCRWPLNSCELEPCLNGGTCDRGLYNSHVCICPQGFTGEDCSFRTPSCLSDPCVNGGRCVDGVDGTYTCECLHGYSGPMCEFTVQPEEDLCDMEFCSDNGNCTSGRDNFTCSCDAGFSGKDCSVADDMEDMPCARNPCLHGGSCKSNSSLPGGFRCKCSPGFTGPGCENNINECTDHPCMNGGTCENGLGGYVCTCPEGMGGYDCQVHCPEGLSGQFCQTLLHPCRENLCQNSGTCTEERGVFSCSCPPAHTGNRCEVNVSCSQSSCRNGGTCVQSLGGGVECECTSDFSGENCELLTVSFSGSKTESSYRAFRSLDIRGHGRIEFEFATTDRDGLLMYNTQLQNGRSEDYIAVEVVGGALRVSISHGSGDSSVSVMNSLLGVSDGDWHQVVIETAQKVRTEYESS